MVTVVSAAKLKKGDRIGGRYEIIRKLGEGGCGSVYRCKDDRGKEVAVKLLDSAKDLPRFKREAKLMARIDHEHVVRCLGQGVHDQRLPYLVLEFMDGGSVRDLLDRRGKLPAREAAWILLQTVRGLKAAKTVHRDLKPENLLLARGGKGKGLTLTPGDLETGQTVKVADFGLAKSKSGTNSALTQTGQVMGTPVYMSPEQCKNTKNVSIKSDVYSLGILLFELSTGKVPFDSSNPWDILAMHCNDDPKVSRVPAELRAIVGRCLQKSPRLRYPTLAALERDLAAASGVEGSTASNRALAVVAILILLTGLGVGAWIFRHEIRDWWRSFHMSESVRHP